MSNKLGDFEAWAFQQMKDDWPHWTSSWLQWVLGRPNSAFREEIVHYNSMINYDNTRVEDGEDAIRVLPAWTSKEHPLLPKEEWLVAKVKAELAEQRRVIISPRQTGTRDIRGRLVKLLEANGVHSVKVLDSKVKARTRKKWLAKNRARVLITNPRLVETGMNLHEFGYCTIVFYEIEYSLYTLWQAMCRVWRLGQLKKVRVFFTVYEKTQEEKALALIGQKMKHGQLLYGDEVTSALVESDGDTSLVQDLIRAIKDNEDLSVEETSIFGMHRGAVVSVTPIGSPTVESKPIITLDEWLVKTHGLTLSELRAKKKPRRRRKAKKVEGVEQASLF